MNKENTKKFLILQIVNLLWSLLVEWIMNVLVTLWIPLKKFKFWISLDSQTSSNWALMVQLVHIISILVQERALNHLEQVQTSSIGTNRFKRLIEFKGPTSSRFKGSKCMVQV